MSDERAQKKNINFVQATYLALHDALDVDPSVFLMGEDIADEEDGGVWKATAGLSTKFGVERSRSQGDCKVVVISRMCRSRRCDDAGRCATGRNEAPLWR